MLHATELPKNVMSYVYIHVHVHVYYSIYLSVPKAMATTLAKGPSS